MLHYRVGSGLTRVSSFLRMNLFSSKLVMVTILVTTDSLNLYLVLHYSLGSGLTREFYASR